MKDKFIVRADNVSDLVSESARVCWGLHQASVLEVLEEQMGPDARENLTPEELIAYGFAQGVGHVLMSLACNELMPVLLTPGCPAPCQRHPDKSKEN